MNTTNLDKLLEELQERVKGLRLPPEAMINRVIRLSLSEGASPLIKVTAFGTVRISANYIVEHADIDNDIWGAAKKVSTYCSAVIYYYMLKGAGCEAEIAEHKDLSVVMEVLK